MESVAVLHLHLPALEVTPHVLIVRHVHFLTGRERTARAGARLSVLALRRGLKADELQPGDLRDTWGRWRSRAALFRDRTWRCSSEVFLQRPDEPQWHP